MSPVDRAARRTQLEPPPPAAGPYSQEHTTARYPSTGLISTILGVSSQGDEGALAALRTLPRRAAPDPDYSDPSGAQARAELRVALLLSLAERSSGAARAGCLIQAAELVASDRERAQALYRQALAADPGNRVASVQLSRQLVRTGDMAQARALWERAGEHAGDARERCLALCAQAELAADSGASEADVTELLQRALRERPASLLAALSLARLQLRAGKLAELASTLQTAADAADLESTRALLLLEAGRAWERQGDADRALRCFEDAQATDGKCLGALLGLVRVRSARGDRNGAAVQLAKLSALTPDPALRAEWTRQRGLVLLDALGEAAQASSVLQGLDTATGLRARSRAAEAAGERSEQERALEAWAQASGGVMRSLVSAEQARGRRRTGEHEGAPQGEALARAAELATSPNAARDEHSLLLDVSSDDPGYLTAEVLAFDAAAELGDIAQLSAALERDAERWPESLRSGPLLAAIDLEVSDPERPEHSLRWQALRAIAAGRPLVTRYLAARASDARESAELWLQEGLAAKGAHAAFAATSAGRYLEMSGVDATEAYADALDAQRGYLPAAFGLEIAARSAGDLGALERVHREIADTTPSAAERCARQVRLGLLNADSDLSAAAHWLSLATEAGYGDAVLDELSIRLAMDQSPAHRADLLEAAAERQGSLPYARAMLLQAAEAHTDASQWDDAIRIYRSLLEEHPGDVYADCGLLATLAQRGRPGALASELETRARAASDASQRGALLIDWAQAELMQGQTQRGHALLERVLADGAGSGTLTALRILQRNALQTRDDTRALQYTLQLSEALEEPAARAAELRLAIRFCRRLGVELTTPLLAAEGKVRELWYARELEALALRTADRPRLYEAFSLLSELAREQGPLERTAYALRAAELLESTAPGRAARELGEALLSAREHPLASEQLARLHKAAGDTAAAAHTFERAARSSADPRRAAALHYTAAVLFQDELNQPERAIDNLILTSRADLLFADTFTRLLSLLGRAGRDQERLALLEARLRGPHEPHLGAELNWERYLLYFERGDLEHAQRALAAALEDDPESSRALAAQAELQLLRGAPADAAESWVRLCSVLQERGERDELGAVYLRLGELYRQQLPDPERAEIALSRAVELLPDDPRALGALAELYAQEGRHQAQQVALTALLESLPPSPARERVVIQHALLRDQLGHHAEASQALADALRLSPASLPLLRAQGTLLERRGDADALAAHLQQGCDALRAAIDLNPADLESWRGLYELLDARGEREAARTVAQAARALGLDDADLPDELPRGLGRAALQPEVLERLAPQGALAALAQLLAELGPRLEPYLPLPVEHSQLAAEWTRELTPPLIAELGLGPLTLHRCEPPLCLPLSAAPLAVCVGGGWLDHASDAERLFGLLRAGAIAKAQLALLLRAAPERFGLLLRALWQAADPAHAGAVLDAAEQARVAEELGAKLSEAERARALGQIEALSLHEDPSPRRLAMAAYDYGSRVALCATGDVWAAVSCLLRLRGLAPNSLTLEDKLELCRTEPALRGLLSFAISELYAEVQRMVQSGGSS